jgi:hypothetical protein
MIVGNPSVFAIESLSTQAFERLAAPKTELRQIGAHWYSKQMSYFSISG